MRKFLAAFTLIELMIAMAIIGIIAAVVLPAATGNAPRVDHKDGTKCVGGYKFTLGDNKQIIGQNGGGVPCDPAPNTSKPL